MEESSTSKVAEKPRKKKLLRVKFERGGYDVSGFSFTPVFIKEDNVRTHFWYPEKCRETFSTFYQKTLNGENNYVDLETMRTLFTLQKNSGAKERMFIAKRMLNAFELEAGWEPSVITSVVHNIYKSPVLLTSSANWFKNPPLMSAMLLLLRGIACASDKALEGFDTGSVDSVIDFVGKIPPLSTDTQQIQELEVHKKLLPLMLHSDEIFGGKSLKEIWTATGSNFSVKTGIKSFLSSVKEPSYIFNDMYLEAARKFIKIIGGK